MSMTMSLMDFLGYIAFFGILGACLYIYFRTDSDFDLKCIITSVDGTNKKFCVRDRKHLQEAANLLANTTKKCSELVQYVYTKYPNNENVKRLHSNFNPDKISEILPTSVHTAYSENKSKMAFCLNVKKNEDIENLIDEHTLTFVAIHELSHMMTASIGHKSEFWENFRFLLTEAKEAGIHDPVDYSKKPTEYCGMTIKDNPYFELQ